VGMICIGAGLAAGFPVMLGFVGDHFATVSGTAFSIVITIALAGNMAVNYLMGFLVGHYGLQHLTTLTFTLTAFMVLLSLVILKKIKT
jgi:FHS family glucose/mannose:H+ symporter-like MFS transporter